MLDSGDYRSAVHLLFSTVLRLNMVNQHYEGQFGFQASEYFCCLPRVIAVGETGTGQKTHLSFFYGSLRPLPSVLGKIPARLLVRYFAARVLGL